MQTHTIDAKDKILGRLASEIAFILQGKKSPEYDARLSGDDRVVVQNISGIKVSGDKYDTKKYYRHSGRVGHLKERTYKSIFEKEPKKVLEYAVRNMLPKNKLRKSRLQRLSIT